MTRRRNTAHKQTPKIAIPATSIAQKLNRVIFGSFLYPKFHTIIQDIDDSSVEMTYGDGKKTQLRRLHFSYEETYKHPTPMADSNKGNHNNDKTFNFIPYAEAMVTKE